MNKRDLKGRDVKLGNAIRKAREAKGISQETLGVLTGTSQSYIYRVELGRVNMGMHVLLRIATALDVEVRDLLNF